MRSYGEAALLGLVFLISGCASPVLNIQGGGFRNMTDYAIENAELRVEATGGVAACSYIAPRGFFSTRLPVRPYAQNPVVVSWSSRGQNYSIGPLVVAVPDPVPDEPVAVVVRMHAGGAADIRFVPVSAIPKQYMQ